MGGPARRHQASRPYYAGPTPGQINRAEKERQAELLDRALRAIESLHRQEFEQQVRPQAAAGAIPDFADLLQAAKDSELRGIGMFRFSARREAKRRAHAAADAEARRLAAQAETERAERQGHLDQLWQELLTNREDAVIGVLAEAFEDNEAPVAPVGVQGDDVSLVVLVPTVEAVPDRLPAITEAGNPSLRKMTKSVRNDFYRLLVAGYVLVSVKEAFAVAPGLQGATVVVVRAESGPAPEGGAPRPILCTRLTRAAMDDLPWDSLDAWTLLEEAGSDTRYQFKGAIREFQELDLADQPDLQRLASVFGR